MKKLNLIKDNCEKTRRRNDRRRSKNQNTELRWSLDLPVQEIWKSSADNHDKNIRKIPNGTATDSEIRTDFPWQNGQASSHTTCSMLSIEEISQNIRLNFIVSLIAWGHEFLKKNLYNCTYMPPETALVF